MDGSGDNLMDDQKAGRPQVDPQAAHNLPTTGYFDTTIIFFYFQQKLVLTMGSTIGYRRAP
ncbi:MAG: hypothetical protein MN733_25725 [Nitrososphaera sp.]|nr:hypothetical protein [Nitrososphaera sp.]